MSNPLIDSLLRAVEASPTDHALRLHLAELLVAEGRGTEAITHCAAVLQHDPGNDRAKQLMGRALAPTPHPVGVEQPTENPEPPTPEPGKPTPEPEGFDWHGAEQQFSDGPGPMFDEDDLLHVVDEPARPEDVWEVERTTLTLADVGGLESVKERLQLAFLAPLRNPELRKLYGKSLRGGLMLYGPPGCGKTFLARAVAGELGASFINVTIADVLDALFGQSEANLHGVFQLAREHAPTVLFFDEIDAIGQRRSQANFGGMRGVVNQLLQELDGVGTDNEGVFVLAATNAPWDVDPALRRPGRLDRTVLVLPPDEPARAAILKADLSRRPIERIDLPRLVRITDGYSGADLVHLCEAAAELAMMDSIRSGKPGMLTMKHVLTAHKSIRPSVRGWYETAKNVVAFSDRAGEFDELREHMRRIRVL